MIQLYRRYLQIAKSQAMLPEYKCLKRQLFEMAVLFLIRQIGPGYYLLARMGQRRHEWPYILGFYNGAQYVKRIYELNDRLYHRSSQNKLIEKAILTAYSIPTPFFLGHYHPQNGLDYSGRPLCTPTHLESMLRHKGISKVCFKAISLWGGQGFKAAAVKESRGQMRFEDLRSGQDCSIESFVGQLMMCDEGGAVVEEYLAQHEELSAFNPTSVNTMRLMIYRRDTKEDPRCMGGYLRVGRLGAIVDNGTAGGIMIPIDPDTGRLESGQLSHPTGQYYARHPDTGVQFEGVKMPFLEQGKSLACTAIKAFPRIRFAGLDIAVSKSGPVVIEMNIEPDYAGFARIRIPSRTALADIKGR